MRLALLASLLTLPALMGAAWADTPRSSRPIAALKRTAAPPVLDGELADPLWKTAASATEFTDPQTAQLAAEQTTVRLAYDEQNVYVAFECRDSQPEGIVGRELVRDSLYQGQNSRNNTEDWVEVRFDPFLSFKSNDQVRFATNVLGTRSARFGGGRANKAEWSGAWDVAVKRTSMGWNAELRIPWSVLNYPTGKAGQKLTMGVNFSRFQYRTQTLSRWSNTTLQEFEALQGRWEGVEVPQAAFRPTLSLLPYSLSLGGSGATTERTGLDARYQPTPELTAVVSANPDFATIENAVQNIAFSRSEQFVEERRPFFLEGGDYFRTGQFFSLGPLFYSNRIQNFDVGAKVFGKLSPRDTLGVLTTQDFGNQSDLVARYRRDLSPTAQAGFFLSQKDVVGGDHNGVSGFLVGDRKGKVGFDSQLFLSGGRVDAQNAGGRAASHNLQYFDGNHFTSIQYLTASPNFRDANGLVFFNDFKGFSGYHNWNREWRKGAWRSFNVDFGPQYWWHQDGRPYQRGVFLGGQVQTRSDWSFRADINHYRFDDQTDRTIGFRLTSGTTNRFRQFGIGLTSGTQGGRAYRFYGPRFSLRARKNLDVIYEGGIVEQGGWNRQHIATFSYQLSPTRSLGGRVVSRTEPGKSPNNNWYLSYRNAGGAGTELFFLLGDPNALTFTQRVAMKLIFAR